MVRVANEAGLLPFDIIQVLVSVRLVRLSLIPATTAEAAKSGLALNAEYQREP